ncbi:MAG: SIS domain-containing protein [Methanopyraceae archaeon]
MSERMVDDVRETPEALRNVLEADLSGLPDLRERNFVITTGSGSSYHVAYYASMLLTRETDVASSHYPGKLAPWVDGADAVIIFSISGGKDSHRIAREFDGADIMAVTCEKDSPLAREADSVLLIPVERESGFLNTKTIVAAMYAFCAYVSEVTGSNVLNTRAPDEVEKSIEADPRDDLVEAMRECEKVFFVGDGYLHVAAEQAALKAVEVGDANALATTTDELFHGRFFGDHSRRLYVCLNEGSADLIEERSNGEANIFRPDEVVKVKVEPDDPNAPVVVLPALYLAIDAAYGPVNTSQARDWWDHL